MFVLTKLKARQGKSTIIHWKDGPDEFKLTSSEAPRPELYECFEALSDYVFEYLDLPAHWAESTEITGITITEGEEGRAATITALRTLASEKVFVMNTPHDSVEDIFDLVDDLQEEARLFTEGKRAQGDLFEGDPEAQEEELEPVGV